MLYNINFRIIRNNRKLSYYKEALNIFPEGRHLVCLFKAQRSLISFLYAKRKIILNIMV